LTTGKIGRISPRIAREWMSPFLESLAAATQASHPPTSKEPSTSDTRTPDAAIPAWHTALSVDDET